MRRFILILGIFFVITIGIFVTGLGEQAWLLVEYNRPEIVIFRHPAGIGIEPGKGGVVVSDAGAGIREISLIARQNQNELVLARFVPDKSGVGEARVDFTLPGARGPFLSGEVELILTAVDRSIWRNTTIEARTIPVDFDPPRVEILTTQHNIAQGGVGLTFYRVTKEGDFETGTMTEQQQYPAYPASALGFKPTETAGIYLSFFAHPLEGTGTIKIWARDLVGNTVESALPALILRKSYPAAITTLSEPFIARVVPLLLPEYYKLARDMGRSYADRSDDSLVEGFRVVNEDYRDLLEAMLKPIFAETEKRRLWERPFLRPLAGTPTAPFGERRTYVFQGQDVSTSLHTGLDLASVARDAVVAANSGKVVFAGFLGIYGDTVIIDHGLGLSTLYGHLSYIDCQVGQMVSAGQVLGRTGMTGLAGGDHLHYEVRLHGAAVRPIEWWDAKWIEEHIEQKIADISESLGQQYPSG